MHVHKNDMKHIWTKQQWHVLWSKGINTKWNPLKGNNRNRSNRADFAKQQHQQSGVNPYRKKFVENEIEQA